MLPQRRILQIVLAAIAAVIAVALIWLALRFVTHGDLVTRAADEIVIINQGMNRVYATSPLVDTGADMIFTPLPAAQTGDGLIYIKANVFPPDAVESDALTVNPWGGSIIVTAATERMLGDSYLVALTSLPQSDCVQLLTRIAGNAHTPELTKAFVARQNGNPKFATALSVPVTAETAKAKCAASDNALGFQFHLKTQQP